MPAAAKRLHEVKAFSFLLPEILGIAAMLGIVWWYSDTEAGGDAKSIGVNSQISHLWNARERAAALAGWAFGFHVVQLFKAIIASILRDAPLLPVVGLLLLRVVLLFGIFGVFFWVWFDIRLNLRRAKAWYYLGVGATADATATKMFRVENPGKAYLYTKAGLFLLLVAGYLFVAWKMPGVTQ